jgi:hypothetical protein
MQGYNVKEKTAIVPPVSKLSGHPDILDGEVKLSMKDIAEQIFTVCAYLVNFQSPIVKK